MSSAMNTILLIGGTSGIGEAFARRWHSQGKKVIITGRRQERLAALKTAHPGLESYQMDNNDFSAIPNHIEALFKKYPNIDTVLINSGLQYASDIKDISSSSDSRISEEIATNVTAPMILGRHIIPRLLSQKGATTFMISGSGLGFVPMGLFPVYCATKAAVHSYMVGVRQTLQGSNVNVIEICPPAVRTDLDAAHKDLTKNFPMMSLEDYINETFEKLDGAEPGTLKEVAAGTAAPRVEAWRSSIGAILEERKLGG